MSIEIMLSARLQRNKEENVLIGELERGGVLPLIEQELAKRWGNPADPQQDPVEERQADFSFLSQGTETGGILRMKFTEYDNTQGEKSITVTYGGQDVGKLHLLRVSGQTEYFKGPIPQNPEQTRMFVEALDYALNTPFRPLAFAGRSSRDLS